MGKRVRFTEDPKEYVITRPPKPWPSKALRRKTLRQLAILYRLQPRDHKSGTGMVDVRELDEDTVQVWMWHGPALECSRLEWTAACASEGWSPAEALDLAPPEYLGRKVLCDIIGKTIFEYDERKTTIVEERPSQNDRDVRSVYSITTAPGGAVRVARIGVTIKGVFWPSMVRSDPDDCEFRAAYVDAT